MNNNETVPYIFHEASQARLERVIKRLWITNIILIGIILICFCVLGVVFYYETQFEDVITTETAQVFYQNALYLAAPDIFHHPLELRPVKMCTFLPIILIDIIKLQIRMLCDIRFIVLIAAADMALFVDF